MDYLYPATTSFKFTGVTDYSSVSDSVSILRNPKSLAPLEWFKQLSLSGNDTQCQSFCNQLLSADESVQQFVVDEFTIVNKGASFRIYSMDSPDPFVVTQRLADFKADLRESISQQSEGIGTGLTRTESGSQTITTTLSSTTTTTVPAARPKRTAAEIMNKYKSAHDPGPNSSPQNRVDSFTRLMSDQHKLLDLDFAALVCEAPLNSRMVSPLTGPDRTLLSKSFQLVAGNNSYEYTLIERNGFDTMDISRRCLETWEEQRVGSISGLTFADFKPDPLQRVPGGRGSTVEGPGGQELLADLRQTIANLKENRTKK